MKDLIESMTQLELNEAKAKPFFGTKDGKHFAVNLSNAVGGNNFPERGFGGVVDNRKVIEDFRKSAKKGYVDAKGKSTLASVKKWVNFNNPTEFYASWKADSSNYKDDSVEILYK